MVKEICEECKNVVVKMENWNNVLLQFLCVNFLKNNNVLWTGCVFNKSDVNCDRNTNFCVVVFYKNFEI